MKISPILALLFVGAPVIAHAQTADTPAMAASGALPMAPKSAATSDAFVWRFAPPVGSRWTMRVFTRLVSTDEIYVPQGNTSIKKTKTQQGAIIKFNLDYDVLSRDALGATTLRLMMRDATQNRISMLDGKTIPSAAPANTKFLDGATLTIKQALDGKIWNVVGTRAFVRRLLKMDGRPDTQMSDEILDANVAVAQKELVKQLNIITGVLPNSPIRMGESWNYTASPPILSQYTLEVTGARTLRKLNSDFAIVVDNAQSRDSQQNLPITTETRDGLDFSRLKVTVDRTSRVQRSSGLPLETTVTQSVKGSFSTQSANGIREFPVDNTIFTRIVIEPRS